MDPLKAEGPRGPSERERVSHWAGVRWCSGNRGRSSRFYPEIHFGNRSGKYIDLCGSPVGAQYDSPRESEAEPWVTFKIRGVFRHSPPAEANDEKRTETIFCKQPSPSQGLAGPAFTHILTLRYHASERSLFLRE